MGMQCEVCGKKPAMGNHYARRGKAKYLGGVGRKVTGISRRAFNPGAPAMASFRGAPDKKYPLAFVRIEPYVIPKKSLTGDNTERVDTRVMQAIYSLKTEGKRVYVGQQLDVFIDVLGDADKPIAPPESRGS